MDDVIICSFDVGLCDLTRSDQRDPLKVLQVLDRAGKFSIFEATDNPSIARTISNMYSKSLIYAGKKYGGPLLKKDHSMGYPWTKVVITEAGQALLAEYAKEKPASQTF